MCACGDALVSQLLRCARFTRVRRQNSDDPGVVRGTEASGLSNQEELLCGSGQGQWNVGCAADGCHDSHVFDEDVDSGFDFGAAGVRLQHPRAAIGEHERAGGALRQSVDDQGWVKIKTACQRYRFRRRSDVYAGEKLVDGLQRLAISGPGPNDCQRGCEVVQHRTGPVQGCSVGSNDDQ